MSRRSERKTNRTTDSPVQSSRLTSPGWNWVFGLLLVVAAIVAYLPVWHAGFVWDDDSTLTNNPLVKAANGLRRIWFSTEPIDYFPLTYSTFWLEWRLWGM